jgi:CheY-like chemotaxis protein
MTTGRERRPLVLVVEEVEETRDGIERLLMASGYRVSTARDENGAIFQARISPPDLILMSPGVDVASVIAAARRIRERAGLGGEIPVVVFCVASLEQGAELGAGNNVYITRPDNFDQLRGFLSRLVAKLPPAC